MIFKEEVLITDRLLIEPLLSIHAEEMFVTLQDSQIYKYIPTYPPKDIDELKTRYKKLESRFSTDKSELWLNWVLRQKFDNSLVGRFEATLSKNRTVYIAYELSSVYWRKGFAYEASKEIIKTLSKEYKTEKIKALVDTRNNGSIGLLEKLQFKKVSFIKNADYFKGFESDEYEFELEIS
jgi:[ribosomal protein S5]-alanine N-acetyltransferase